MPDGGTAATLGVVGGGQLGRMLAEAAAPLGVELVVLDPTPDCPAAAVARDQVVADFDDPEGIATLARRSDALTVEIELAGPEALETAAEAAGVPVHPDPGTLSMIRDKLDQKRELQAAGIPVPAFRRVDSASEVHEALDVLGAPAMLKARTGGYDGRGNVPVASPDQAADALAAVGGPAMVEELVDFDRELSVIIGRGADTVSTFPPGENVHKEEILRETIVPARTTDVVRDRAVSVARNVLEVLDGRGIFGIELFESDGEILVNEIAPRPHNSGHWTIEGAVTSQFEQHVRAVMGYPLGSAQQRAPTVMTNILGDVDTARATQLTVEGSVRDRSATGNDLSSLDPTPVLADTGAAFHWYGKREVRPQRKMGHITLSADRPVDDLLVAARRLRDELTFSE